MIAARLVSEGVDPATAMAAARPRTATRTGPGPRDRPGPRRTARCVRRGAAPTRRHRRGRHGTAAHLLGLIDAAAEPLAARHAAEVGELDERIKAYGERGSGKKQLDERHKRELRRYRTDELRSGLAAMAATYRDTAVNPATTDVDSCADAVRRIHRAMEMLDRNPNEKLLRRIVAVVVARRSGCRRTRADDRLNPPYSRTR